jgi:hypothetical protein
MFDPITWSIWLLGFAILFPHMRFKTTVRPFVLFEMQNPCASQTSSFVLTIDAER